MSTAAQNKHDKHETNIVERMTHARELAQKFFGERATTDVVHEIHDYLAAVEENDGDEGDFIADLESAVGHAKKVYETTAPTGDQVFGLFERIFNDGE